jgi:predicted RNase H-like HicB family nuclease
MAQNYSIVIQYSEDDGGYIALVPELPGVSAFGITPELATKEVEVAMQAMIEEYERDGCHLPEPDRLKEFSGQLRIRIPKSLHTSLHLEAKREGVSLNSYISTLLAKRNESKKIERHLSAIQSMLIHNIFNYSDEKNPSSGDSVQDITYLETTCMDNKNL